MGKINALTHLFSAGEISRAALNRVDKEIIRLHAERQENLLPYVIGKAIMRPGLQYIEDSRSNNRPRLVPFFKSLTARAVLEFTDSTLRVMVDDVLVTRASVTSTVTNGDFSSSTGWTLTVSDGATGNINSTVSGALYMQAAARGSSVICTRSVSTSSADTEHALRIAVTRGPVTFRCGSTSGGDEYIRETTLDTGTHSLAFTPSGTYHVWLKTRREAAVIIDSIQVESAGVMEISAPWTTAQLREISLDQSGDIIYLAHESWQQRKIERRGDASWSLVLYKADDGPFTIARTAITRLKPAATHGNTTLTAESAFFRPEHVGALFRLDHGQFNASFVLAGNGAYTDAWRVTGITAANNNDRTFTYQTTGTWVGTVSMQRSLDSEDSGFRDSNIDESVATTSFTTNQTFTHAGSGEDDNQIYWQRLGFKDAAYTSGSINIAVQYQGHSGYGICRVTEYTSSTQVSVEVLRDFRHTEYTEDWLEGEWSDHRGWPSAVGFFDGRLFWAGRDKFWGSVSNSFDAFNLETEGDSGSIQRSIATGGAFFQSRWILGLQRLIFGTDGAEISARSSSFDEPLTPTNITLKPAATNGVAPCSPVRTDTAGIYIDLSAENLMEIRYNVDAQDYVAGNLTRLHEDLHESLNPSLFEDGFVEVTIQRKPENYVLASRDDGMVCAMLRSAAEDASGIFKIATGRDNGLDSNRPLDRIVSIAVLPNSGEDDVYCAVERTISDGAGGSAQSHYIEKFAAHGDIITRTYSSSEQDVVTKNGLYMADSYITATATGMSSQVISGLDHLEGRVVIVIGQVVGGAYGPTGTEYTVNASGQITLTDEMTGTICIGLPYEGFYKSAKLAFAGQAGTALLQKKAITQLGLALLDTHPDAIRVGPSFDEDDLDELPRTGSDGLDGEPVDVAANFQRSQEEEPFPFPGEWDTDSRVHIKVRPGYSACLSAMLVGVETHER
jgi:hypothetical protein